MSIPSPGREGLAAIAGIWRMPAVSTLKKQLHESSTDVDQCRVENLDPASAVFVDRQRQFRSTEDHPVDPLTLRHSVHDSEHRFPPDSCSTPVVEEFVHVPVVHVRTLVR
jgi:hypothetical protein